ncbi:ABC transporter permease [Clostridium senegalense]|uniref:ABC transporter permease n=1 Tax=Clostridium senegalense TaxID=1465809 RepID=A0A6M0H5P9_9CLOT|nr:ABC transporter permease [Clostridium senegalense]NEU06030.1 ABC transporter permease [Clostridium senegalense]
MKRLKVIMAMGKKGLIELVRYRDWIIGLIIWPAVFPLVYILNARVLSGKDGSLAGNFVKITGYSDFKGYILIGSLVYMWVNMTLWSFGSFLRSEQKKGTLESLWICPINKFDIMIGGSVVTVIRSFIYVFISILEYKVLYGLQLKGNLLQWIVIFVVILIGVIGIGSILASLVLWVKEANVAVHIVRGIVMVFAGISFPIIVMPNFMQIISKSLSFTFGIEAARAVMLNGSSLIETIEPLMVCLVLGVIYFIIGRLIFVILERKVREEGSLSRF